MLRVIAGGVLEEVEMVEMVEGVELVGFEGKFFLKMNTARIEQPLLMKLYDMHGTCVLKEEIEGQHSHIPIPETLNSGVYVWSISSKTETKNGKILLLF